MFADSLVVPIRVVSVLDPALDRVQMPVVEYSQSRDPSLVHELPGRAALWCVVRPLSVADFMLVDSAPTANHKLRLAFRWSVDAIENWGAPGMALRGTRKVRDERDKERDIFEDREIDQIAARCGVQFLYEIGSVAYERAVQGNEWSGSAIYTLPPSSVLGLELIARRAAEQGKRIAGMTSNERFAPPNPTTSSASSDAAIDAHAPSGAGAPVDTSPTT